MHLTPVGQACDVCIIDLNMTTTTIIKFMSSNFKFFYLFILFITIFWVLCLSLISKFLISIILLIIVIVLQVVAFQLGKGHTGTAICCARLPSSSVTALHHLPGPPPPEKEFVMVASYLSQPKASQGSQAGPAHTSSQGLLSVFEVCTAGTAGQTAAAASNRLVAEVALATAACMACGV